MVKLFSREPLVVADLFTQYELIAKSGLFDAEYYIRANPDVALFGMDPLLHYLERGAIELRNPSDTFEARLYVELCQQRGERVENPLLHFIQTGAQELTSRSVTNGATERLTSGIEATNEKEAFLLDVEQVRLESDQGATRLVGSGWCLGSGAVVELEVEFGAVSTRARYGLPRADVAREYPQHSKADHAGFEFVLGPVSSDLTGTIELRFTAKTALGASAQRSVPFDLAAIRIADTVGASGVPVSRRLGGNRPPMQLCIDSAEVDDAGILHLTGWAVCLVPIVSVQVSIDDEPLASAEYGKLRDDVGSIHPGYPNARKSGFALHVDVSSYSGNRFIKVQALASTGISRETLLPFTLARKRRAAVGDQSTVQFFCDVIEVTTGGQVVVTGWAVAAQATERITVELDEQIIGNATIGIERPDVGNLFPALTHARRSGFSLALRGAPVSEGEHLLILRHSGGGEETEILLPILAVPGSRLGANGAAAPCSEGDNVLMNIDLPHLVDGSMVTPVRGNLQIEGWALARQGVASIDIAIDGERISSTSTGLRRIDVQRAFPKWDSALTSGFTTVLPHRTLPRGDHIVSIEVKDRVGLTACSEFRVVVEEIPDMAGPWALRRRMKPAEVDVISRPLLGWINPPSFAVVVIMPSGGEVLARARMTLGSLAVQVYEHWSARVVISKRDSMAERCSLMEGFDTVAGRIELLSEERGLDSLLAPGSAFSHLMILRSGDELSCDALLEFAVHATLHQEGGVLYCDERRISPSSGKVETFFKPQWSPDLLLSMNYLGRAWCAQTNLFRQARIRTSDLASADSYGLTLRLTEQAKAVYHLPATLFQAVDSYTDNAGADRKALRRALVRRGISGTIRQGRVPGAFRVQRQVDTTRLVSIIIPTCAARGLIRTCLETLRSMTAYRNFEIVVIENIPADQPEWKLWVRANANTVIETIEPFNWSRFNNIAVKASRGEFLVFLNDDIEIIDPDWMQALLEHAERPEVGAVGPQLLYPDGRVQHAGLFLTRPGVARHAFRGAAEDEPCYFGLALTQRNIIAVTGACLMTRRKTFDALGGFNEKHDVVNNDLEFCLRVRREGLRTIYTPHTKLIHHELASRSALSDSFDTAAFTLKWRSIFVDGDPFFSPHLSKERDDFSFEWEPTEVHCSGNPILRLKSIRRILVVKLDHIGDCVIALPAVRRLKKHFPWARISVLTSKASRAIWLLEPAVDEIIEFNFFRARSSEGLVDQKEEDWQELRDRLAPHSFDLAIDLRRHGETREVLRAVGAQYLAGFDTKGRFPWLDISIESFEDSPLIRKRQHATDDLLMLADAVAAAGEQERASLSRMPPPLPASALAKVPRGDRLFRKRVVCVHPGVGNEMRQWPTEYFSVLIDQLIESEGVNVVIIGGPDEEALGALMLNSIINKKAVWPLFGALRLADVPSLIARCALFVGNNSGPQHVAAGLGVPTVGIHSGVVDVREWGAKGNNAVAMQRAMTCSPCYLSKPEDCMRGLACLRGLLPGDVLRISKRLLRSSSPGRQSAQRRAPSKICNNDPLAKSAVFKT